MASHTQTFAERKDFWFIRLERTLIHAGFNGTSIGLLVSRVLRLEQSDTLMTRRQGDKIMNIIEIQDNRRSFLFSDPNRETVYQPGRRGYNSFQISSSLFPQIRFITDS